MSAKRQRPRQESGAALLAALLTVALVATLAAAGLWQQWRAIEVEAAERQRSQASWVLAGALDWARLILREDAIAGNIDHLGEPWAVPLREARLATFLAANRDADTGGTSADQAFLSGEITDLQSRLNLTNLVEGDRVSPTALVALGRLFTVLGLPASEAEALATQLVRASRPTAQSDGNPVPLPPQDTSQLVWLGLSPATAAALAPYVTVLPQRTPVNLNTAPAAVIYAATGGTSLADAQRLVVQRGASHLRSVSDAIQVLGPTAQVEPAAAGVSSRYFEIKGRLRIDQTVTEERSLVYRENSDLVRVLSRHRGSLPPPARP